MACFVTFYNPLSNRKEMLIFFVKGCALYLIYFNIRLHFTYRSMYMALTTFWHIYATFSTPRNWLLVSLDENWWFTVDVWHFCIHSRKCEILGSTGLFEELINRKLCLELKRKSLKSLFWFIHTWSIMKPL